MSRHILILGGGISGLSCAYYLKKEHPEFRVTLLEASPQCGGWIQTLNREGFLFDLGPRSLRTRGSGLYTLHLVEELGLQKELISCSSQASKRFLWTKERLHPLPKGLLGALWNPLTKPVVWELLKEWKRPATNKSDESIYEFFSRRLNSDIAENLADPLTLGIFAGDIRKLSIRSCFPSLWNMEKHYGSLVKGLFLQKKHRDGVSSFIHKVKKHSLFNFKKGLKTLIDALEAQCGAEICKQTPVTNIEFQEEGVRISSAERRWNADAVISTLPSHQLAPLLHSDDDLFLQLKKTPFASVGIVHLGYRKNVLKEQGFGHLVPSKEKQSVLGVLWESCIYPQQQEDPDWTRLTVMLRPEAASPQLLQQQALEGVAKQLKIEKEPDFMWTHWAHQAIPQYEVGHAESVNQLRQLLKNKGGRLLLGGNSYGGVGVNDCIETAYRIVKKELLF